MSRTKRTLAVAFIAITALLGLAAPANAISVDIAGLILETPQI